MIKKYFVAATLLSSCLGLSGCIRPFHPTIQQGNLVSQAQIKQLHQGMSQDEVVSSLGTPLLANVFDNQRSYYIYTVQKGYRQMSERQLTIIFNKQGRVLSFSVSNAGPTNDDPYLGQDEIQ